MQTLTIRYLGSDSSVPTFRHFVTVGTFLRIRLFPLVELNTGIVGSNPTQGMDVCVRLFIVRVVLCVGRGLMTR
jgi:hypothetical protein